MSTTPAGTFEFIPAENYLTVKLNGSLQIDSLSGFEEEVAKLTAGPKIPYLILDCKDVSEISPAWLRSLVLLQKKLQQGTRALRMINLSHAVQMFIHAQGLEKAVPASATLREALVGFGVVAKLTLDVNFINPFLEATMKVLEIQTQTLCKAGAPCQKGSDGKFVADISGVIGLVSDNFNGSVVISFPEKTFLKIMSRMMGEELTVINKDIEDGAGELTNMIFGQAKLALNEKGYGIKTALPSVVKGANHSVQNLTKGPIVVVPFETDAGSFFIEICLSA